MPALRCTNCSLNWPARFSDYGKCPVCKGSTWHASLQDAMSESEARHVAFDQYFKEWDERREMDGHLADLNSLPTVHEREHDGA